MKTVAFRVDFGSGIGQGHLSRCIPIARECQKLGMNTLFLSREHKGTRLESFENFPFHIIGPGTDCKPDKDSEWIGVSEDQDANETLKYCPVNTVIFKDHYSLGEEWEKRIKQSGIKLFSLDDGVRREHHSDVLIDYNILSHSSDYLFNGKFLSGPEYFPCSEKLQLHSLKQSFGTNKILLTPGSVNTELLNKLVKSLADSGKFLTVIHPQAEKLHVDRHLKFTANLPEELKKHDLVIGACGVAFLERCLLKVPQFCFQVSGNQKSNARYLKSSHPHCFGGDLRTLNEKVLKEKLLSVLDQQTSDLIVNVPSLDFDGAKRIAQEIQLL